MGVTDSQREILIDITLAYLAFAEDGYNKLQDEFYYVTTALVDAFNELSHPCEDAMTTLRGVWEVLHMNLPLVRFFSLSPY